MLTPTFYNIIKSSLKTFYDIDPLIVDHMVLRTTVQVRLVCSRSAEIFSQAHRSLRDSFSVQPLGSIG